MHYSLGEQPAADLVQARDLKQALGLGLGHAPRLPRRRRVGPAEARPDFGAAGLRQEADGAVAPGVEDLEKQRLARVGLTRTPLDTEVTKTRLNIPKGALQPLKNSGTAKFAQPKV